MGIARIVLYPLREGIGHESFFFPWEIRRIDYTTNPSIRIRNYCSMVNETPRSSGLRLWTVARGFSSIGSDSNLTGLTS
jgi:hypothetical protein